jgi:zinc transport system substrate-binding protein
MNKALSLFIVGAMMFTLSSCGSDNATKTVEPSDSATEQATETSAENKIQVYASFYTMADFASQIGGDKADVYTLCPVGSEPHDFEPTAQDMAKLTSADIFIYNGKGMESWAESVADSINGNGVITIEASAMASSPNGDPHVWLNPEKAYSEMEQIADAFIAADAENRDYYADRLAIAKEKTDTLTNDYKTAVSGFKTKEIVVSHDAYSNLCDAFSITAYPINGVDNDEDPSPSRMAELEELIKNNNIKYIFSEPLGTSSIAEAIASDTGCEILMLDPFEGSTQNKDYFTVMYENLDALKTALN